jgi:hypothetical protein
MFRGIELGAFAALILFVLATVYLAPAEGQNAPLEIRARGRVFPEVGAGLIAIKRDAAGHCYVIASPASTVQIFSADGKRIGQIPDASIQDSNSQDAKKNSKVVFAADFDVDSGGRCSLPIPIIPRPLSLRSMRSPSIPSRKKFGSQLEARCTASTRMGRRSASTKPFRHQARLSFRRPSSLNRIDCFLAATRGAFSISPGPRKLTPAHPRADRRTLLRIFPREQSFLKLRPRIYGKITRASFFVLWKSCE